MGNIFNRLMAIKIATGSDAEQGSALAASADAVYDAGHLIIREGTRWI
jgi:hypothetical protein